MDNFLSGTSKWAESKPAGGPNPFPVQNRHRAKRAEPDPHLAREKWTRPKVWQQHWLKVQFLRTTTTPRFDICSFVVVVDDVVVVVAVTLPKCRHFSRIHPRINPPISPSPLRTPFCASLAAAPRWLELRSVRSLHTVLPYTLSPIHIAVLDDDDVYVCLSVAYAKVRKSVCL